MCFRIIKYSTMRRLVHLSLLILCLPLASLATDYYWIGGTTGAQTFSTASNWSTTPGGSPSSAAPGSGDIAIFQATTSKQIGAISFADPISVDAIVVDSTSGGVSPNVTFSGTLTLGGSAISITTNPLGNITYSTPTGLVANYGTINVSSNISVAYDLHTRNSGTINLSGTTTFSGASSLDANGTGGVYFNNVVVNTGGGTSNVNLVGKINTTFNYVINGNLTMTSGGMMNSSASDSTAEVKLGGNLTSTAAFTESTANLRFIGSADQTIDLASGSEARWGGNIIFDVNSGASPVAKIILNSPLIVDEINQSIIFNNGIVSPVDVNNDYIKFDSATTTSGANNNSYVDGFVYRTGTTDFIYPIGNAGYYAPVKLSGSQFFFGDLPLNSGTGNAPTYRARYLRVNPLTNGYPNNAPQPTDGNSTPTVLTLSQQEYFVVDFVSDVSGFPPPDFPTATPPYIWFSYENTRSGGLTDANSVVPVNWLTDHWGSLPSSGYDTTAFNITYIRTGVTTTSVVDNNPVFSFGTNNPTLNPLPVKWLSFTGTALKGVVELNWSTASELDNRDFTIQRSADGNSFQSIGTVEGKGTTTAVSYYAFTDQQPLKGIAYYRIKQTDINGKFSYSSVIRISNNGQNGGALRLYPNPAVTSAPLKVEYSNFRNQLVTVSIINAAGIVVHKELVNFGTDSRATLNISRLQRGSYFVSMVSGSQRQTIPFVIQ
jgi:hypothetical protein